jgi:hypothetical protein
MHSRTHPRRGPARRRRVREAGVADELIAAANPGCQMEKTFLLTSRAQHARLVTRQSSSPRARGRRSCASSADHGPSRRLTHAGTRNSACPETSPVRGSNKQVRPYVCINFVKKSTAVCVQVVRWEDAHRRPRRRFVYSSIMRGDFRSGIEVAPAPAVSQIQVRGRCATGTRCRYFLLVQFNSICVPVVGTCPSWGLAVGSKALFSSKKFRISLM